MKSFFNKANVEYIDVYYYFKEVLKPKLNKMYYYDEIIEKIKHDEYLNKHFNLFKVNQYQGNFLINKNLIKIEFILLTYQFAIKIISHNKEIYIRYS